MLLLLMKRVKTNVLRTATLLTTFVYFVFVCVKLILQEMRHDLHTSTAAVPLIFHLTGP